jgi:hypothetical protein
VLVAVVLASGPLLWSLALVHSGVRGAQFNVDRGTARQVLTDLSEILMGEPVESLSAIAAAGGARLDALVAGRVDRLPDRPRRLYRAQVAPLADRLSLDVEVGVAGLPGLVRLSLSTRLGAGQQVTVTRLFRPLAHPAAISG